MAGSVLAVVALAACGGSSGAGSASHTPTSTDNGIAAKSPAQAVAAAQAALRSAKGFVVAGTLTQHGQTVRLAVVDAGPSKIQLKVSQDGGIADMIVVSGIGYVRANNAFWAVHAGPAAARLLADRWVELPASVSSRITSSFGEFRPQVMARCLGENHGTLSRDGSTTIDGAPAAVIHDAGNAPGDSPGTLAIAKTGPPFPLRITTTGPTRPGGKVDVCNTGKGDDTRASLTFGHFDKPPTITVPKHPLKVGSSGESQL